MPSRRNAGFALAALALVVAAWLSPRAIPYNMDEFVHYQALACATAPQERGLPSFRDGCGLYDLRLPFTRGPLPLRSYLYIGSLPAVPFYPLWRALGDPVAARVQGALFALLAFALATRLLRVRTSSMLAAALVFPILLATFVVDEGPVGLSAVLLLSALLALRRGLQAPGPRAGAAWGAAAGALLFAGLWTKLVFAWWLPAVAWVALRTAWPSGRATTASAARRALPALLAAALACAAPTAILFASVDRDGRPYLHTALHRGRIELAPENVENQATGLWLYAVDGARVAPRNLVFPEWPIDVAPAVVALAVLVGGLRGPRRREVASWSLLAAVTFAAVSSSLFSQWPHHFFFPLLLGVLGMAAALDGLGRRSSAAVALVAVLFWATLAARWPAATFPADSSFGKDALLRTLRDERLDCDRFVVHASWGTYYIAQLFGDPARVSVFLKALPDDPRQLQEVRALAAGRGRPILVLSSRRWDRLQTAAVTEALGEPRGRRRFGEWWAVEYDPTAPAGLRSAFRRP
jgi:hypothetical protein